MTIELGPMPDEQGYFGEYGGQIIPPELKAIMDEIDRAYEEVHQTEGAPDGSLPEGAE